MKVLGLFVLLGGLALLIACNGGESAVSGASTAGKIAFDAKLTNDPARQIYVVNADGSGLTSLTGSGGAVPVWSPDGKRIAFECRSAGDNDDICIINADGSGLALLTSHSGADFSPAWSPDGRRIAFTSNRNGNIDIYVINADGSRETRLTNDPTWDFFAIPLISFPTNPWSPDGKRIAFTRGCLFGQGCTQQVYIMNADGSGQTRLADSPALFFGWSPDSKKILFVVDDAQGSKIYVMNADGTNKTRLTKNLPSGLPVWSPDGSRIAFTVRRDSIYVMNADGSSPTRLTDGQCDGLYGMAWSPDGQRVAFTRGCDDSSVELWVVNTDGSGQGRVAGGLAFPIGAPAWTPAPRR